MTTHSTSDQLNQVSESRVAAQVSVSLSHGGIIGLDFPISQPTSQSPASSHHTPSLPVPARVPHAPTTSFNKARGLSPPLPYSATNGAGFGIDTSSSDGSDRTRGSATKTTSSRRQRRDGSPRRTSRGHWILGDYTLTETLGVGSMGKVKLTIHKVTGEKVFVILSLSRSLVLIVTSPPSPSLLSRFCHAHTSRYLLQTSRPTLLNSRPRLPQRRSAPSAKLCSQHSSTIPTSVACTR